MIEKRKLIILSLEKEKDQLLTRLTSMRENKEELNERVVSTR